MILLRPFIIFITFVLSYIPVLQFVGLALLFFIYHVLIRNRNLHIERMKKVYQSNNLSFPDIKEKSPIIWFALYIVSFLVLNVFYLYLIQQVGSLTFEEMQTFALPSWQIYLFLGSFLLSWISYASMINRIDRDQWQLQESEISNKIVKNRFIKLREGNVVMLLRIITLDIYQWFLLFFLIRETTIHYFEDGTATGRYLQLIKKDEKETQNETSTDVTAAKPEQEDPYEKIINQIKNMGKDERYSTIFSHVTSISDKKKAEEILEKLLEDGYIKEEEYKKLQQFL
ncbi:hypothetical protein [Petrotoga sibirica]|uniref:Uncharacterized protein n=2 Tax=Petrotoga sibirica TaxID=156202 RepID=A0A4R8F1V4_9BACT|nr:hypothetical protein [Petrotoga sibirica]POZ87944.1 hypothetical protein AA80_08955 [Petrotoga sibirica DSM 13575]TDX16101.1 hypothetical protein C8D74_10552 [Petrotoga sibirica]